jgi:ferredoxin-NADP reductase
VRSLTLRLPERYRHVPGQHYVLRLTAPDGTQASRSYSVASPPDDSATIELAVERLEGGEVSTYVHEALEAGDRVEVRGPFGGWFVWRGDTPVVLVGGGSGVVPLVSMLRYWRAIGWRVPLRLLVSVRTPADLLYAGEYGSETTVIYTRESPPSQSRAVGRLVAADLAPLLLPGAVAYVCGSGSFADAASHLLVRLGVSPADVRVERFGPS